MPAASALLGWPRKEHPGPWGRHADWLPTLFQLRHVAAGGRGGLVLHNEHHLHLPEKRASSCLLVGSSFLPGKLRCLPRSNYRRLLSIYNAIKYSLARLALPQPLLHLLPSSGIPAIHYLPYYLLSPAASSIAPYSLTTDCNSPHFSMAYYSNNIPNAAFDTGNLHHQMLWQTAVGWLPEHDSHLPADTPRSVRKDLAGTGFATTGSAAFGPSVGAFLVGDWPYI